MRRVSLRTDYRHRFGRQRVAGDLQRITGCWAPIGTLIGCRPIIKHLYITAYQHMVRRSAIQTVDTQFIHIIVVLGLDSDQVLSVTVCRMKFT